MHSLDVTRRQLFSNVAKTYLRKISKNELTCKTLLVFKNECEDISEIFKAGVTCTLALYVAQQKLKDLNLLRYNDESLYV